MYYYIVRVSGLFLKESVIAVKSNREMPQEIFAIICRCFYRKVDSKNDNVF